jgi:hypothetical protein
MNAQELIAILQAKIAGKEIQYRYIGLPERYWVKINTDTGVAKLCEMVGEGLKLRVKPEPLERWGNVYENGMTMYHETEACALSARNRACLRTVRFVEADYHD